MFIGRKEEYIVTSNTSSFTQKCSFIVENYGKTIILLENERIKLQHPKYICEPFFFDISANPSFATQVLLPQKYPPMHKYYLKN